MKEKIIYLSIFIFIVILIVSSYFIIKEYREYKNNYTYSIELIDEVMTEDTVKEDRNLDWNKLSLKNKDIIGWIKIQGTNIDYPIVKDTDKLYYLKHTIDGKYSKSGSIFTLNTNPFKEKETTIYGHNMKNSLMFSQLDQYMKKDFLKEHGVFEIYTEKQNYKATIFSCYSTGLEKEESNLKGLTFNEKIEYYKNNSKHVVEDIGEIEKIVKLSTCSYINNTESVTNQRYYIVAKLENLK